MAITAQARTDIIRLVVGMFGAAPGASVLSDLVATYESGRTLAQMAGDLANTTQFKGIYPTFLTNAEFATKLVDNLVGAEVSAANRTWAIDQVTALLNSGQSRGAVFHAAINGVAAVATTDANFGAAASALANKTTVAEYYSVTTQQSGTTLSQLQSVVASVTSSAATVTSAKSTIDGTANAGSTFTLTTGADNFTGFTGNDTFNGSQTTAAVWTVGDKIDGGAGTDVFNVTQTAAITLPLSATVVNVETVNLTSGTTGNDINTTTWTGLTTLNMVGVTAQTVTAAGTTAVNVTGTSATGTTTINGGSNVSLTETGANAGTVSIGATTAATGTVTVSSTGTTAGGTTGNAITVKGGTDVTITQAGGNAVNTTNTQGAVTVTGTSATKNVTVTQDKAATASATVAGKVNGTVTVNDVNAASATSAGTIASVTLNNYGNSTIDSSAITTVSLSGSGGTLGIGRGALTAVPTANTLTLNVNGLSGTNGITDNEAGADDGFTQIDVVGNTAASTIADLTAADIETLNISGAAKVTFTANTLGTALKTITITNTAGASLGGALAAGVTVTGGSGDDSVSLATGVTKAVNMGAGNDTVTYGGPVGTGGSVAGGDGEDTIVMSGAEADAADVDSTFNSKYTSFEVLSIETGATETIDVVGLGSVAKLTTIGANGLTVNNLGTGGTATLTGASTTLTLGVRDAAFNAADTFNLVLSTDGITAYGTVTIAGVETINITTPDPGTASAAAIHTATLAATSATKVTLSGNNGLTLTNTGNTKITTFDASGVVAGTSTDTAANLAVTFVSANTTGTATVTITGGAGNDTLTGDAAKDNITGGAGNDLITGGAGQDTVNLGSGRDIVAFTSFASASTSSPVATADVINNFGLVATAVTTTDFSSNANFQSSTAGGANLSLLNIDADTDGANTDQAITLAGATTGAAGVAVGVTAVVSSGRLTLTGTGASAVDTLAEWVAEANGSNVANTVGEIVLFNFGSDTYVFMENGANDLLIQLVGVTGTSLVEVSNSTTASAGAVLYADVA